MLFVIL